MPQRLSDKALREGFLDLTLGAASGYLRSAPAYIAISAIPFGQVIGSLRNGAVFRDGLR